MLKFELKKRANNVLIVSQHDLRHKTFEYIFNHTHSKIITNIDTATTMSIRSRTSNSIRDLTCHNLQKNFKRKTNKHEKI